MIVEVKICLEFEFEVFKRSFWCFSKFFFAFCNSTEAVVADNARALFQAPVEIMAHHRISWF